MNSSDNNDLKNCFKTYAREEFMEKLSTKPWTQDDEEKTKEQLAQLEESIEKATGKWYRKQVLRLWGCTNNAKDTLISSGFGLAEEAGEYVSLLKKHMFHGHELDKEKVKKELGDIRYYLEIASNAHGFTMQEIEEANIEKLNKRYQNGFSNEASINRKE